MKQSRVDESFGREQEDRLAPSHDTLPSAAGVASTRSLDAHDADVYAGYLRDLRQQLQEPPEFVFYDAHLPAHRFVVTT